MAASAADISSYKAFATQMANQYNIPSDLFLWQIDQESNWQPDASSKTSSAKGIAQFIDSTAKERNVNVTDPYDSIQGAASYMADLKQKTGNWMSALNAYGTTNNNPAAAAQAQKILDSQNPSNQIKDALSNPNDLKTLVTSGKNPDGTNSLNGGIVDSAISGATNIALVILFFIFGLALVVLAFASTDSGKEMIKAGIKGVK